MPFREACHFSRDARRSRVRDCDVEDGPARSSRRDARARNGHVPAMDGIARRAEGGCHRGRDCIVGQEGKTQPEHAALKHAQRSIQCRLRKKQIKITNYQAPYREFRIFGEGAAGRRTVETELQRMPVCPPPMPKRLSMSAPSRGAEDRLTKM